MKYAKVYIDPFGLQAYNKGGKGENVVPNVVEGPYVEAEFVNEEEYYRDRQEFPPTWEQIVSKWGEEDITIGVWLEVK